LANALVTRSQVLIVDVRHTRHYARTLREAGLDGERDAARSVESVVSRLLRSLTFGSVQAGYVIGSKAR